MNELDIYNCHIHIFTTKNVPRYFPKMIFGDAIGRWISELMRDEAIAKLLLKGLKWVARFIDNPLLERLGRFLERGMVAGQETVLQGIMEQYPPSAKFIVLPMDMKYMNLGRIDEGIDKQHDDLLELAGKEEYAGKLFPFFAADPRREDLLEKLDKKLAPDKFRGVKIYPNLGYQPDHPRLKEVYALCVERDVPVMSHCTAYGVWQYGLTLQQRVELSHPRNYEPILKEFPKLRICLAHFGGGGEWDRHLKRRDKVAEQDRAWVKWIADLIRSGNYPNLYTDISYTIFKPQPSGMMVNFFDYLNVLLEHPVLRERVLFGSDYYMVEREPLTEREVSIMLRSRLGRETYFQLAHHNVKRYLGIEAQVQGA